MIPAYHYLPGGCSCEAPPFERIIFEGPSVWGHCRIQSAKPKGPAQTLNLIAWKFWQVEIEQLLLVCGSGIQDQRGSQKGDLRDSAIASGIPGAHEGVV